MEFAPNHIQTVRYDEVASTNVIALEFADQGAPEGTVIQALQQTGGRGRLGRSFFSPPGGLYFSLILRPETFSRNISFVTLAAGVICSRLIEKKADVSVMLKWPNDLYHAGRKLGGILTEAAPYSYRAGKIPYMVVGIGLNINTRTQLFPEPLRKNIISLYSIREKEYNLDALMSDISVQIQQYVHEPDLLHSEILSEWNKRDYLLGKAIHWQKGTGKKRIDGTGAGLLDDGQYVLLTAEGEKIPILGGKLGINTVE